MLFPILLIGFIVIMHFLLDPLLSLGTIGIVITIVLFLVGWFVVIGIGSKDNHETIVDGAKDGIHFLKEWLKHIVIVMILAIALIIFFGANKFY